MTRRQRSQTPFQSSLQTSLGLPSHIGKPAIPLTPLPSETLLTRRKWLTQNATALLIATHAPLGRYRPGLVTQGSVDATLAARVATHATRVEPDQLEALAQRAVEAARTAGARYADARLTREVQHHYEFVSRNIMGAFGTNLTGTLTQGLETIGVGVRVLVDGYWGFAASTIWTPDEVVRLAREAVAQAQVNAKGTPRTVELGQTPAMTGRWASPVKIDPFIVPIEEKSDYMAHWVECLTRLGLGLHPQFSYLHFARQERVVATSDGSCVSQTVYESGGAIDVYADNSDTPSVKVQGIDVCGKGWELFLEAGIPEQFTTMRAAIDELRNRPSKPATVGRYTLVCDGATMASLVAETFGIATQLDRALGYEANAGGTSYLNDPLGMLGTLKVASPLVTVTANRSAPTELATVKWDDEGVVPQETTLVNDGILHDFQTTREQAAWLAPYYAKAGRPVRSHGHAAAEDALYITMQQMPNLALAPSTAAVRLEDLVADVKEGILITNGTAQGAWTMGPAMTDQQARNGVLIGELRQIRNGRLGPMLTGGAVLFNTTDLWKHVTAMGGATTEAVVGYTGLYELRTYIKKMVGDGKGQPAQLTSHSVRGVAATIADQTVIDPSRKA